MRLPIVALTSDIPDEQLLTTADVASILAVSRVKAAEMLSHGTIVGAVRVGTLLRIPAGKVRAWLEAESLPKNPEIFALRQQLRGRRRHQ